MPDAIHTPYDPDSVIGEFGWLWDKNGPMGPDWRLVQTVESDGDEPLMTVFAGDGDGNLSDAEEAEGWRGRPYLPCLAPTAEPGKSDALEVAIRLPRGASATHSLGAGEEASRIGKSLTAILNPATRGRAAIDVLAERRRQIEVEGWTPEHDDLHEPGALAEAGACYAWDALDDVPTAGVPLGWPFEPTWWKPTAPRRELVKAAALILAEIERLDREDSRDG